MDALALRPQVQCRRRLTSLPVRLACVWIHVDLIELTLSACENLGLCLRIYAEKESFLAISRL
jgi:hypothetical protein